MVPAYKFVPPYETNPFSVLIWNAYAPSFHPNAQIDLRTDPFGYSLSIRDRAAFYWPDTLYYSGEAVSFELWNLINDI
jgi:hypothetical protein